MEVQPQEPIATERDGREIGAAMAAQLLGETVLAVVYLGELGETYLLYNSMY